jgi:hypothetical protein
LTTYVLMSTTVFLAARSSTSWRARAAADEPRPRLDGTVTEIDGLHMIIEEFGDREIYRVTEGSSGGRCRMHEVIAVEMATLTLPLADAVRWVREHVTVRPGFRELARRFRPTILSSGFCELIEPVLEREGVSLEVHANRLDPRADGWRAIWRDEAQCDQCGEACKRGGSRTARRSCTSATACRTAARRSRPTESSRATASRATSASGASRTSPSRTSSSWGPP